MWPVPYFSFFACPWLAVAHQCLSWELAAACARVSCIWRCALGERTWTSGESLVPITHTKRFRIQPPAGRACTISRLCLPEFISRKAFVVFLLWFADWLVCFPLWSCGLPDGLDESRLSRPVLGTPRLLDLPGPQITGWHGNGEGPERKSNLPPAFYR